MKRPTRRKRSRESAFKAENKNDRGAVRRKEQQQHLLTAGVGTEFRSVIKLFSCGMFSLPRPSTAIKGQLIAKSSST